ncbi:hypothetical protein [Uliginosibacterium flavum]
MKTDSSGAWSLASVSFICFIVIFLAEVLGYKVSSSHLSLEKQVNALEERHKELQEVVSATLRILLVMTSKHRFFDGPTDVQRKLAAEYLEPIKKYVVGVSSEEIDAIIQKRHSECPPDV